MQAPQGQQLDMMSTLSHTGATCPCRVMSEFDRLYFTGDRVASATATKYYVLPSTFYMTQTRRQYADMLK
jgi:hypothetical protein